ncbi:MAG: hypothetical protein K9G67_01420 [Bacteroidales bacterium]|nr:hypothetical protein [Bacteroidales bacterium]MCF8345175.1 hypothetical protein [Bacteroidales bacterium]MCF8374990.1 hypothetical protein [Bacteroidales bacterium]
MKPKEQKFIELLEQVDAIIKSAEQLESKYGKELSQVNHAYKKCAVNLIHYMALRSHDITLMQKELRWQGLPDLVNIEGNVMRSLLAIKTILNHLTGKPYYAHRKGTVSIKKSAKILNSNTRALFGYKSKKRRTRIMVTMPKAASKDLKLINDLVILGMNSARINCAHDDTGVWKKIIENVRESSRKNNKEVKIVMDLAGPKIRTGPMKPGPQVICIRPETDAYGKVVVPAKVWLAPPDLAPPSENADVVIPFQEEWISAMTRGTRLEFRDARERACSFELKESEGRGRWAWCYVSAYVTPETSFTLIKEKERGDRIFKIGELPPFEEKIVLRTGDRLILHKEETEGEPARYDESGKLISPAQISCTMPEIFQDVKKGEPVMFDDGKIEGLIKELHPEKLSIVITQAKDKGSKLASDKGINFPESDLSVNGLTQKDREDLKFVSQHADAINLSFVNDVEDVKQLRDILKELKSNIGIILKIETRKGYENLPAILLHTMQSYPVGIMLARGDLAVEVGWKDIAGIQEEIMRISEAAHIPNIWATQVLENLAKKGTPSRAEITDVAVAQRAQCVMLNKGIYIRKAVRLLDRILKQMQGLQKKKKSVPAQLEFARKLKLSRENSSPAS